ncbi:MAG: TetR/AcrR family transcriptional regulator [Chitinophagaceae bacterium]
MDVKERIREKAKELFFRYGFKSVTMDEIASQLGMSKKTLYQYYADKDMLVDEIMDSEMECMRTDYRDMKMAAENAIDECLRDLESMEAVMNTMNPIVAFDLEKFYPKTFAKFKKYKNTFWLEEIRSNIERGRSEELYRTDFDIDIISRFRIDAAFIMFNQEMFPYPKYNLMQVSKEIYLHFLNGIVSAKGKKILDKYIAKRNK